MGAAELIVEAMKSGIALRAEGERLLYHPASAASEQFINALREHKPELVRLLRARQGLGPGSPGDPDRNAKGHATERLMRCLKEKEDRLSLKLRDLAYPDWADEDWTKRQIAFLEKHIAEVNRFLVEGGELGLPLCCIDRSSTCLIAMEGFDGCVMAPQGCGFSLWL